MLVASVQTEHVVSGLEPEVQSSTSGSNRKFVVPLPVSGKHVVVHEPAAVLPFVDDQRAAIRENGF